MSERTSTRNWATWSAVALLLASCTNLASRPAAEHGNETASHSRVEQLDAELTEVGRLVQANEIEAGGDALTRILHSNLFPLLSPERRHQAIFLAGALAYDDRDSDKAHGFFAQSSEMQTANGDDWWYRLLTSPSEDMAEQAECVTQLAKQWPDMLVKTNSLFVLRLVFRLETDNRYKRQYWDMLEALHRAQWKSEYGTPSTWWRKLALHYLEGDDVAAATAAALDVQAPHELVGMRADNRFRAVVESHPEHFDIANSVSAEIDQYEQDAKAHPRSLPPVMQLTSAFLHATKYSEALTETTSVLRAAESAPRASPAYDDESTNLVWIMDARARALWELGRWDDAIEQLKLAIALPEDGGPNVSHVINLSSYYCYLSKPDEALNAIAKVGTTSPYGAMQVQKVRLMAAVQLNDQPAIQSALDFMNQHQADAEQTYQEALLFADRQDEAAQLFISRLQNPDTRFRALQEAQVYSAAKAPEFLRRSADRWRAIIDRRDVQAAIAAVGNVQQYPLGEMDT